MTRDFDSVEEHDKGNQECQKQTKEENTAKKKDNTIKQCSNPNSLTDVYNELELKQSLQ